MGAVVYQIRNATNGKVYVGSTIDFRQRRWSHIGALRKGTHHCAPLQVDFIAFGESVFLFEVLEHVDPERCHDRESYWMAKTNCHASDFGYNVALEPGGTIRGLKFPGRKHSEETKKKIGDAHRGMKRSPETGRRISMANMGKIIAPESSRKTVETWIANGRKPRGMTGKRHTAESREKMSVGMTGKNKGRKKPPRTAAHRSAMSASRKGCKYSDTHMAALAAGSARRWEKYRRDKELGIVPKRTFTAEQRKRMSDGTTAAWARRKLAAQVTP